MEIAEDLAAAWLRSFLEGVAVPQDDVMAAARLKDVKAFALDVAAQHMGVIATSDNGERWRIHPGVSHENCYQNEHGRRARWTWSLPAPAE